MDVVHRCLPVRARIRKQTTVGRQRALRSISGKRARGEKASLSSDPKSFILVHSGHTGVLVWSHAHDNPRLLCLSFRSAVAISYHRNRSGSSVVRIRQSRPKSGERPRRNSPQRRQLNLRAPVPIPTDRHGGSPGMERKDWANSETTNPFVILRALRGNRSLYPGGIAIRAA